MGIQHKPGPRASKKSHTCWNGSLQQQWCFYKGWEAEILDPPVASTRCCGRPVRGVALRRRLETVPAGGSQSRLVLPNQHEICEPPLLPTLHPMVSQPSGVSSFPQRVHPWHSTGADRWSGSLNSHHDDDPPCQALSPRRARRGGEVGGLLRSNGSASAIYLPRLDGC